MYFEMRDATDPERLPEVETSVFFNDVVEEPVIEVFLDEPINTPDNTTDVRSPRLVMTLPEAWTLWHQLGKALGPEPEKPDADVEEPNEEPEPSEADFEHLEQGMTVVVQKRETTWEPGDDAQTEVVVLPGTEATVIDWVVEWFHVHVQINPNQPGAGQHVWICPDNLKEKK